MEKKQQNQMTRDEFNKAHVACIVLGKYDTPSTDELIEENYAFGKWINLDTDEKTWNTKIHELQKALEKPELQQKIKGIKIKGISIHKILMNEFQKSGNVDRVYCHNVIPGLGMLTIRHLSDDGNYKNYFIHTPYYVSPNVSPTIQCMSSDVAYMRSGACRRKYGKYVASEADKSVYPFRIHAPDCFLYFPLKESEYLNNETLRKFNKEEKDKFLGWGEKEHSFKSTLDKARKDPDCKKNELILKAEKDIKDEKSRYHKFATEQFNEENKKRRKEAEHRKLNKKLDNVYRELYTDNFCSIQ